MAQTRKTDYQNGQLLEIVKTTFHDYPLGTIVKVINTDWHSYHVVNVTRKATEKRFWWVDENQVKPVKTRAIDLILCPVSSKYGAPMGRPDVGEKPTDGRKVYESFVRFYDGAYDKGGAYWGGGRDSGRLFVQYTRDLSYIRFYRVAYP